MTNVTDQNFELLIAYLLPGFVCLWGASYFSETAQGWLTASPGDAPTIGGFLYATLASVAAGLVVSALRWLLIDRLHRHTGIAEPSWNFAKLPDTMHAFEGVVRNHYRIYQFYSNTLVAVCIAYGARLWSLGQWPGRQPWLDLGFLLLIVLLGTASRDALRKYYSRGSALLGDLR